MPQFLTADGRVVFWVVLSVVAVIVAYFFVLTALQDRRGMIFKHLAYEIMKELSVGRRESYHLYADDLIDLIVARDPRFKSEPIETMETWLMEIEIDAVSSDFHYDYVQRTCSILC